jgi:transposase
MGNMAKHRPPYPPEFRAEAVRLVRVGGRSINQTARDLGCSPEALHTWLKQADLDAGRRTDGLTSDEREELRRLRQENRVLRLERDLLKKPRPSSPRRATRPGERVSLHPGGGGAGHLPDRVPVCAPGGRAERVLRLAAASSIGARAR